MKEKSDNNPNIRVLKVGDIVMVGNPRHEHAKVKKNRIWQKQAGTF